MQGRCLMTAFLNILKILKNRREINEFRFKKVFLHQFIAGMKSNFN